MGIIEIIGVILFVVGTCLMGGEAESPGVQVIFNLFGFFMFIVGLCILYMMNKVSLYKDKKNWNGIIYPRSR